MLEQIKFEGLGKLPEINFGPFCAKHRIKISPDLDIKGELTLVAGLQALYEAAARPEFFTVIATALPPRQAVWFACLCTRDMLAEGADKPAAQQAAEAWVYKPNLETRKAVEAAIKDADMDDPTVMAADAAFHGIVAGLENTVKSPDSATPAMVFGAALQSLFRDPEEEAQNANWQLLVARSLNIAAGGNGNLET